MRIYKLRFDMLICFLLAALMVFGTEKILPVFYSALYDKYLEAHTVADGDIGGIAGDDVYRAQNVDELLSHDTFTVKVGHSSVMIADTGYFGDHYLLNLELPSGERIAACINNDAMQRNFEDDLYIMPVGKVVKADLSADTEFLSQIEASQELSRTDFYLDMSGKSGSNFVSAERYDKQYTIYIKAAVAVISFFVFHIIGCKLGLFPPFIPRRRKNRE